MKKTDTVFTLIVPVIVSATPSTQIWIPSTDVQPFLNPHLGYDAYIGTKSTGIISNAGITMGVLPTKKVGLELGIDYRDLSGNHDHPGYGNFKVGTPENGFAKWFPALAVGMYDIGFDQESSGYNLAYGLAAKSIGKAGRFSFGGFKGGLNGHETLFASGSHRDQIDDAGVLVSWDKTIKDKLWFCVDFQSGMSCYGAVSFGAAWYFAPNVSVIAGYDIYNDSEAFKPTATVQFDINLK